MSNFKDLLGFSPAKIHNSKSCFYISYYAKHPLTNEFKRVRIKLNSIKTLAEKMRTAKRLVNEINEKLHNGWNPFLEESAPKGIQKLSAAASHFLKIKGRELRPDSVRTYTSQINLFEEWLSKNKHTELHCVGFSKMHAMKYMDHLILEKELGNKTFNNYLVFMNSFWNWMKENKYVIDNVFADIRKKKEETKTRTIVSEEDRKRIYEYLELKNKPFQIVCQLVYHALIRPKEITQLKREYFNFENQTIFIPGEDTKNGNPRISTIPNSLINDLKQWDFNNVGPNEYIFGKNKPICPRRFSKMWDKMRTELNLPKENMLYSLRDSGIAQMLRDGISIDEVQKQADHHSLEITQKYLIYANPNGSEAIKTKSSSFG